MAFAFEGIITDIVETLKWVLLFGIVGGAFMLIMFFRKYKYQFTVKRLTGGKIIVVRDIAKRA